MIAPISRLALALALAAAVSAQARLEPQHLRCEYRTNPLGLDTPQPRLSWELHSRERDQRQRAYQIRVASSEHALREGGADLWDTGRVLSDQAAQRAYGGAPLRSRQRCWWTVRAWDQDDRVSDWSTPAFWEMGLLSSNDWQAQWIGLASSWAGQASWPQARWIWAGPNLAADGRAAPPETNRIQVAALRRWVALPPDRAIARARLRLTADDYFELFVNGRFVAHNAGKPYSAKFIQEYELALHAGDNLIAIRATNRQDCAGVLGQLAVEFERGPALTVETDRSWGAQPGWADEFSQPSYIDVHWRPATELAAPGEAPWEAANYPPMLPAPFLRTTARFEREIRQARLYVTALGVYECYLNGQRVGHDEFNPGWTDYRTRVQYHTYDVTSLLHRGDNAFGLVLGDGWYAGFVGLAGRCRYGQQPLARAQLELAFADGTTRTIATDPTWKAATGPIRHSDFLMGEHYDARREFPGWDRPGFDDAAWSSAMAVTQAVHLVAAPDAPVRATQEVRPIALTEPRAGHFVFDLGQNLVGRVRLQVQGPAGRRVTLRYAEMVQPDGTLYLDNLREARCTDDYVLRGGAPEVYEPHFTFHGFRYVEVTGYPGRPDRTALTGVVLHSDTPRAGTFACSDPLVTQLYSNIVWGQRGNFLSIPTDCPQRDERLGWTGDAQVFIRTATWNMDVAAFFTKWCQDLDDAQRPDGAFPDAAPFVAANSGTAAWGDAGVICPWTLYQVYGDRRLLEAHYPAGQRWIEYLLKHSTNGLRPATRYGDWLSIDADTPLDVLATAYFAHSADLMARSAAVLGRTEDQRRYAKLFQSVRSAFNQAYVAEDGRIRGNTQTSYLMALAFDLLSPAHRAQAIRYLVEDIQARGDHLSTGFVGVGLLMPTLTRAGHVDRAYRLLRQDTFPSWLYSVRNGATTIWERWDGWTRDRGFQTPWMNSFNHYSLGSVGHWLFETVAGIGLAGDTPGFRHCVIRPQPGGGLTWARAEYRAMPGRMVSAWRLEKGRMMLDLDVPANTTATVYLPSASREEVAESGRPVRLGNGIRYVWREGAQTVLEVGSGQYRFAAPTGARSEVKGAPAGRTRPEPARGLPL